jgi:hypothetical protein
VIPLPLTPYPWPSGLWAQTEYVACLALNVGFSAHRAGDLKHWFHYKLPTELGGRCVSLLVFLDRVEKRIEHNFNPDLDWIHQAFTTVNKEQT